MITIHVRGPLYRTKNEVSFEARVNGAEVYGVARQLRDVDQDYITDIERAMFRELMDDIYEKEIKE